MYEIGSTFRTEIANDNRNYAIQLNFTFPDSSTLTVTNAGVWEGGLKFEDATSDSEFQVGSAIVNKLSIILNNIYDDYSEYDFDGASVVAYIGIYINGVASEFVRRGTYIVNSSDGYNTALIRLECYDYLSKFDKEYALVNTNYPATLQTIVQNICTTCGVTFNTPNFYNRTFVVQKRPDNEGLTCRQMLAFAAQIACSFARCDEYGRLELSWFNMSQTTHSFTGIFNVSSGMEPIAITGVRVTEEFPESEQNKKNTILYGNEGYVLEISGNDLIQQGSAFDVAEAIGRQVVNAIPFYKVNATILSDPSVEVGDTATITDNKGNTVFFPITRVIFETDNSMTVECSARDAVRNSAKQYTELTRAMVKARQIAGAQVSEYDLAVQQLTELMSESFGIFKTEEVQQDGSSVYILHNKPTLESSDIQWKMTANGLAVSQDYGQTWVAGIDSSGNAVVNVLDAIGINAGWINTGELNIGDAFQASLDTGTVVISGDNVFIGDVSATDALAQLSGALTVTLSNEMQGIPVDSHGDYGTFPPTTTQIRVLYGSQDVTMQCTLTASYSNVTGSVTDDGSAYTFTATGLSADSGYAVFTAAYDPGTGVVRNSKRFNLYKVYAGADGPPGQGIPARTYFIEPSVTVIKQGQDKEYIPQTVRFDAYYRDGNETIRHQYTGLFRVETTTDGITWETVEYPTVNKTYTEYTPTDSTLAGIRCTLYSSAEIDTTYYGLSANFDGDTVLTDDDDAWLYTSQDDVIVEGGDEIDLQSVAVVVDVSALSQDEVFNILTNNSANQGLYKVGNTVYVNASYLASGIIRSQENLNTYWNLNTGALQIQNGSINIGSGKFVVTTQGALTATGANITGDITATSLTLSGSASIPSSKVTGLNVYVQKDGTIGSTPSSGATGFKVSSAGLLEASNARIWGTVYASAGLIGGWTIDGSWLRKSTEVSGRTYQAYMYCPTSVSDPANTSFIGLRTSSNGGAAWSYPFAVQYDGKVIATNINASGGNIAGWSITPTALEKRTTTGGTTYRAYMFCPTTISDPDNTSFIGVATSTNGGSTWSGLPFSVSYSGRLYASNANITGSVTATSLTATNYLYVNGSSQSYFRIPISEHYPSTSGEYIEMGPYGFFASTRECDVQIGGIYQEDPVQSSDDILNGMQLKSASSTTIIQSNRIEVRSPSVKTTIKGGAINVYNLYVHNDATIYGDLVCAGGKPRIVDTEDYGTRFLYAYETPAPMFGDVGEGIINVDGICYIPLDPVFVETINTRQYQVFLQAYGDGQCYVSERHETYFVVAGTPNMEFGWEVKSRQADLNPRRFERYYEKDEPDGVDYGSFAIEHLEEIQKERNAA